MSIENFDIAIIGAGPAGLASAIGALAAGSKKIVLIERTNELGGILNQCIHEGFGLHKFKEELTGPEYAQRYIDEVTRHKEVKIYKNTTVLNVDENVLNLLNDTGIFSIKAKKIIFATGCLERTRTSINLSGKRLSGIITAGTAQKFVNIQGLLPGKNVVILGSGDIGLIMARRLHLEGVNVKMVLEINSKPSGLMRNVVQCLNDYNIPLKTNYTVLNSYGETRLTGIDIVKVDSNYNIIENTIEHVDCDTLLLSVGLVPFNKIPKDLNIEFNPLTNSPYVDNNYQTLKNNIYIAGNCLHVNDLADNVSEEAYRAGYYAILQNNKERNLIPIKIKGNIRYIVPSYIDLNNLITDILISFRVKTDVNDATLNVYINNNLEFSKKIKFLKVQTIQGHLIKKEIFEKIPNINEIEVELI